MTERTNNIVWVTIYVILQVAAFLLIFDEEIWENRKENR